MLLFNRLLTVKSMLSFQSVLQCVCVCTVYTVYVYVCASLVQTGHWAWAVKKCPFYTVYIGYLLVIVFSCLYCLCIMPLLLDI